MSMATRLLIVSVALAALPFAYVRAATDQSAPEHDTSSVNGKVPEVTVTAQHARAETGERGHRVRQQDYRAPF